MSNHTHTFYNKFSFFYPCVDLFLSGQKKHLFKEINKLPCGQLLEIGVGHGKHLHLYKKHQVTGIDTSQAMLQTALKYKKENTQLLHMNGENLHFADATFDYVVLSHVMAVVAQPDKVLEESYRVLKPGGQVFILNHFTPNNSLRHLDSAFQRVGKLFHFRSLFYISNLKALHKFTLLKEINVGQLSYFKLLIYAKL